MHGVTGERFLISQEWDMGDIRWLERMHGGVLQSVQEVPYRVSDCHKGCIRCARGAMQE